MLTDQAIGDATGTVPYLLVLDSSVCGGDLTTEGDSWWARWGLGSRVFVLAVVLLFTGYAVLGRGFAYVRLGIYVGEMGLLLSVLFLLGSGQVGRLIRSSCGVMLIAFALWQVCCTLPYVSTYGLNAYRDAASWGYAGFAWATAAMVLGLNGVLPYIVGAYRRFSRFYVVIGPVCAILTQFYAANLPKYPGSNVPIPTLKNGDLLVHLAGVVAFAVTLGRGRTGMLLPLAFLGALVGGTNGRGGLLSFFATIAFVLAASPTGALLTLFRIATAGSVIAALGLMVDVHFSIPGSTREVSMAQVVRNATSIVDVDSSADLASTSRWRQAWWDRIIDYTIFGPFFWTGKGYGLNLADDDGFQVSPDTHELRNPHNSHLMFLARSGVPGFALWLGLQCTWMWSIARCYLNARRRGLTRWAALLVWIVSYWLVIMINSSFDVALEGPMLGIPFWSIYGLGWGATALYSRSATTLPAIWPEHPMTEGNVASAL